MNKKIIIVAAAALLLAGNAYAWGKRGKKSHDTDEKSKIEAGGQRASERDGTQVEDAENEILDEKTGFPAIKKRPFVMFNEGVSYTLLTRLEKQDKRSNFVRQNHLAGLYFSVQSENMKPVNSMIRVAAYYPFFNTFNGMQQFPKQPILYAFDLLAAPMFQADMWKYVRLNFAGGLHYMYQLTDEYHMNYLGGGLLAGLELPLAKRWTILTDGTVTVDYPNLGTNRIVQPFDLAWQYNVNVGVRYSRRGENKYSYLRKIRFKKATGKGGVSAQTAGDATAENAEAEGANAALGDGEGGETKDGLNHAVNR
ncbi:MAG: hypothetical protein ACTTKL_05635 [Treponema sp.]